jgi:hypothetical protein
MDKPGGHYVKWNKHRMTNNTWSHLYVESKKNELSFSSKWWDVSNLQFLRESVFTINGLLLWRWMGTFLLMTTSAKYLQADSSAEDRAWNRTEPMTEWTPNPWKAYLHPVRLNAVPVSICLEKSCPPFLPSGPIQGCLCKSTNPTGEHHTPHATPPLCPGNIVQHS